MAIDDKIRDEKLQYDINRATKAAKNINKNISMIIRKN